MPGIKELKTRIKSIGSTRKITRAMQLVSAAKMRKAQMAVLSSRAYAEAAWEIIQKVAVAGAFRHPLIQIHRRAKKIGIILLSSNRGFVGSLNTNLLPKIHEIEHISASPGFQPSSLGLERGRGEIETVAEIVTYGKKSQILAARLKKSVSADFPKLERRISVEDIYPLARFVSELYGTGQYRKVVIVYNHFVSTIRQLPTAKQLLPFSDKIRRELENYDEKTAGLDAEFVFEPDPQAVVEHLMPRIIESQIYQAILESDASEHSARMVMMKNATEAAGDLIDDLTLTFNQLRQGKITTELAEITAGKIALE